MVRVQSFRLTYQGTGGHAIPRLTLMHLVNNRGENCRLSSSAPRPGSNVRSSSETHFEHLTDLSDPYMQDT
jgi:hypothetical protein